MAGSRAGQAFIVGAQRSGTTSLATALEAHPEVALAQPRSPEPKVFLSPGASDDVEGYVATYYAHAGPQTRLRVEKSASYLESDVACGEIRRAFPDAHILVLLRDPVDRAISHWAFSRANGVEDLGLADALRPEAEDRPWDTAAISVSPYRYLSRGRYVDDLRRWADAFGPDRLHVVVFEDLLAEPERFTGLEEAIGLTPGSGFSAEERHNAEERAEALDDRDRARLAAWFADANADLAELLGRPIDRWTHP